MVLKLVEFAAASLTSVKVPLVLFFQLVELFVRYQVVVSVNVMAVSLEQL